ncbi:MAG: hypothetical protein HN833_02775 [Elusimicrobiaceae bacterium]|jgi:hypothetical protein|nr:hypothetical protein [Elusimicrobiaceae bacterium]MBT3955649.1 hypothetical protein [Elusimicrobiaceae bacterium]MBT4008297.1 hypothetical protein [Elusimicrobiaceae bacterium]MBT4403425.1 hypothetical protein [Elusimicrobiaceae bacterium]MBT4439703.1 hypothetical protein [Elusimicrobiaceae bacterium]
MKKLTSKIIVLLFAVSMLGIVTSYAQGYGEKKTKQEYQEILESGISEGSLVPIVSALGNGADINLEKKFTLDGEEFSVLPVFFTIGLARTIKYENGEIVYIERKNTPIETLKFLTTGFTGAFIKIDKEVYYFGYMCDALTVAIIRDSIEAVKHLNSLEEVDVNDKTGDGIPKIFFAKSLKMLKELVDNQKADVSAKTKSGLSFIDFLITKADFNAFSYGKNVDLDNIIKYSMVNYLNNLGVSYNNTTKKLLEENNVLEKKVDKEKLLREVLEEVKKEE